MANVIMGTFCSDSLWTWFERALACLLGRPVNPGGNSLCTWVTLGWLRPGLRSLPPEVSISVKFTLGSSFQDAKCALNCNKNPVRLSAHFTLSSTVIHTMSTTKCPLWLWPFTSLLVTPFKLLFFFCPPTPNFTKFLFVVPPSTY